MIHSRRPAPVGKKAGGSFDQAKEAAYRFLSYRDRSEQEVALKLQEKGFAEDVIAETLSFLTKEGYLDDSRFARQWARSRMEGRQFGPIRLRGELLEKGIAPEEIEKVLTSLSDESDLVARAERALLRRFKTAAAFRDLKTRRKAFDFLRRKGFGAGAISKAFKGIGAGRQGPEAGEE